MSEHEGFCVPLLESMYFNVPIIAYNSSAIPYTLGGTGLLFNDKQYKEVDDKASRMRKDVNSARMVVRQNYTFNQSTKRWEQSGREVKLVLIVVSKPKSYPIKEGVLKT